MVVLIVFCFALAVIVEVDYVRSQIVEGDICVRNGMVHKVSNVLGVPTRSIWKEINHNDILT
jgi:hypothetical protein